MRNWSVWLPWRVATEQALYADDGFYRSESPASHFRTSVHASPRFAGALLVLLGRIDAALGHPAELDVIDMGAGRGELLSQLVALAPKDLAARLHPVAVELRARPPELPDAVEWRPAMPDSVTGLVIANEWLDNVPVNVAAWTHQGFRLVLVDPETGEERLDGPPEPDDQAWLDRWWPLTSVVDRAEIGRPRDEAWVDLAARVRRGVALAIDYGHTLSDRPPGGTLAAYRLGRSVVPIPDGTCDICTHVAVDSCAEATFRSVPGRGKLTTQREVLRSLGVHGKRPLPSLSRTDPLEYLRLLRQASEEGELIDPSGLGGFRWLIHLVDVDPVPFDDSATG